MSFNIAIDGPAGAGKSTIAKKIAKELGFVYVDTGAMYRAMALYFLRSNISNEDEQAISRASENVEITIQYENGEQQVFLNGENVSGEIRKEEVGNMASKTSGYGQVREKISGITAAACEKSGCCHGRKRHRNRGTSGCTGQSIFDGKRGYKSQKTL